MSAKSNHFSGHHSTHFYEVMSFLFGYSENTHTLYSYTHGRAEPKTILWRAW